MGNTHWLLLIPYYFFGALGTLLVLILLGRITRVKVSLNLLATTSVILGLGLVSAPILVGWIGLADYTVKRMILLAAATCLLALFDAVVQPRLSLPLDGELEQL